MIQVPDLLTHVLVGWVLGILLAFRIDWIRGPQLTAIMVGAASPDLNRVDLLLPAELVEATIGITFSWSALHYVGGNIIVLAILALLVTPRWRLRVFALLLLGAASHHALDLLLLRASGYAYPVLWPITDYHPPAGMLFRSSDRLPAAIAILAACAVYFAHKRWAASTLSTA